MTTSRNPTGPAPAEPARYPLSALVLTVAMTVTSAIYVVVAVVPPGASPVLLVAAMMVLSGATAVAALVLRARCGNRPERAVWRTILVAVAILAASLIPFLVPLLVLVPLQNGGPPHGPPPHGPVVTFYIRFVGTNVAFFGYLMVYPLLYRALVRWNRFRTSTADPADWLIGIGAGLVVLAALSLREPIDLSGTRPFQGWLYLVQIVSVSAVVVLMLTTLVVARVADLARDPRLWVIFLALLPLLAQPLIRELAPIQVGVLIQVLALPTGGLLLLASQMQDGPRRRRRASNGVLLAGGVAVLAGAVVVLLARTVISDATSSGIAAASAVLAVIAVVVRGARVFRELGELAGARAEASTDELTGLPNRRFLLRELDRRIRAPGPLCLAIIDLDQFKAVNDRFGHAIGDTLLNGLSSTLAARTPRGAVLARLGGDEFAVLVSSSTTPTRMLCGELRDAVRGLHLVEDRQLRVDASIGIASRPAATADTDEHVTDTGTVNGVELMRRADLAMYEAKARRTGVCLYDRAIDAVVQDRLRLSADLRAALEPGSGRASEFTLFYQPQIRLSDGCIDGAEALLRWRHPELGLLTPDRFLELAHWNGLMGDITRLVVREAGRQWLTWQAYGARLRISVNLSPDDLVDPGLMALLDELVSAGVCPGEFVLEITEDSPVLDHAETMVVLRALVDAGFAISIDDYGTGYSGLSYLADLPASELKIDKYLTARLDSDPRVAAIVAATVDLAHELGLRLVMEGVETPGVATLLRRMGCEIAQGFLYSPALSPEEFERLVGRFGATGAPDGISEDTREAAPAGRRHSNH